MPVRSRGQLLAGIGALLGVCAAGSGCQSTGPNTFLSSPLNATRQAFSGATLAAPQPVGVPVSQGASVVRVSATATDGSNGVSSTWHDTQHLGDSGTASGGYVARSPMPLSAAARAAMDGPAVDDAVPTVPAVHAQPDTAQPKIQTVVHYVHHDAGPAPGIPGVPKEMNKESYPRYQVEPPDILFINASPTLTFPNPQPLQGNFLIRMDGYINLGIYGEVYVAGLTLEQVRDVIANQLKQRNDPRKIKLGDDGRPLPPDKQDEADKRKPLTIEQIKLELQVDVTAFNSKVYYIITDGAGYGEQVVRVPATGNETVLDALGLINGLPGVSSKKKIWIARATPQGGHPLILPVDWCSITKFGLANTNYQIYPGDRIYVDSQSALKLDSALSKILNPIDRILGSAILGTGLYNSIRYGGASGTGQ